MRIIAGQRKGMKLIPPPGMNTRPVTDRVKESLFSILFHHYGLPDDAVVADLFCGTGSMGLEALSRGAALVTFIDKDPRVINLLEQNIEKARFKQKTKVLRTNAFKTGAAVLEEEDKCSLVFVDPPYVMSRDPGEKSPLGKMLAVLNQQLLPGGIVVVRTHKQVDLLERYGRLVTADVRKWSTMKVTLFEMNPVTIDNFQENPMSQGDDSGETDSE